MTFGRIRYIGFSLFYLILVAMALAPVDGRSEVQSDVCRNSDIRIYRGVTSQDLRQFDLLNIKFYEITIPCFEYLKDGFRLSFPTSDIKFKLMRKEDDFSYRVMNGDVQLRKDRYLKVFRTQQDVSFTFAFAAYEVPEGVPSLLKSKYIDLAVDGGSGVRMNLKQAEADGDLVLPDVAVKMEGSLIHASSHVDGKYTEAIRVSFETPGGHVQKVCNAEEEMTGLLHCEEIIPRDALSASVVRYRSDDRLFRFRESAKTVWVNPVGLSM